MAEAQAVAVSTVVEGVEVASMVAVVKAAATEAAARAAAARALQSPRPATRQWCSAR